jgi:hypothetical protein
MGDRVGGHCRGEENQQRSYKPDNADQDQGADKNVMLDGIGFFVKLVFIGAYRHDPVPDFEMFVAHNLHARLAVGGVFPWVAYPAAFVFQHFSDKGVAVTVLGIDDVFYREGSLFSAISPSHLLSVFVTIIMTAVVGLGLLFKPKKKQMWLLSLDTFIIIILYMALMIYLFLKK